jgi:lipid A 3-O-deacylase
MNIAPSTRKNGVFTACLLALSSMLANSANANQFGLQFVGGVADHDVRKAEMGFVWDPGLTWWEIGGYHFTVVGEGHVAYWDIREHPASHPNIWEFGLTPVLRFVKSSGSFRPYIEAGVGVRLLSHVDETPDRSVSSSFQFADMVGLGAQYARTIRRDFGSSICPMPASSIRTRELTLARYICSTTSDAR